MKLAYAASYERPFFIGELPLVLAPKDNWVKSGVESVETFDVVGS